jgi:cytochrome bd-type quinol oxidase subunit 2
MIGAAFALFVKTKGGIVSAFAALYGILALIVPFLVVGAIVYLIVRRRNGHEGVTAYHTLITYFYAVMAASVLICAVGLCFLLDAAFGQVYDGEGLAGSVTTGCAVLVVGIVILALHSWGRRRVEDPWDKDTRTLKRIYLFFMLAVFSIAGLVSLPLAVANGTHYSLGDFYDYGAPNTSLSIALIAALLWMYFFWQVIKELRVGRPVPEANSQAATSRDAKETDA